MESPSTSRPASPGCPSVSIDFPGGELSNALKEHSFGISRSEIVHTSSHEARARITLLEEREVAVVLTTNGYNIVEDAEVSERTFESLDDLLVSISPRYREIQQQTLLAKLQLLVENQGQSEKS